MHRLYVEQKKTTREIAGRFGCSNGTISRWLENHNIETRENWKDGVEKAREVNRVEYVQLRTLPSGYEYWASKEGENGQVNKILYVHRLLAVSEHGFEKVIDSDVHHINGIPWDNRPENLELMDPESHGSLHANERHHDEQKVTN
jgi:transcriptional regulator with XRE-family HTH domain